MTKLSRGVSACISAVIMLAGIATSAARADTFFYLLDNNTLAEANGGPPLVSYGGTLNNGYHFGSMRASASAAPAYSMCIR